MIDFLKKIFNMLFNINGGNFEGTNLTVKRNKVYIDDKLVEIDDKVINITVNGNIDKLKIDSCDSIDIIGNVGSCNTMSGDVKITGDVLANVETMSGNVRCNNIRGNVKTMSGNISKLL